MARRLIGPCSHPGCGTPIYSRYLCEMHYRRWLRHGDPKINLAPRNSPEKPCAVPGCAGITTRTYCNAHEKRFKRYGDATYKPPKVSDALCSVEDCGRQAYIGTLCRSHHRRLKSADSGPAPAMLTAADVRYIQENRGVIRVEDLARLVGTDVHTVIAVQAGRNWGRLLQTPKTSVKTAVDSRADRRTT